MTMTEEDDDAVRRLGDNKSTGKNPERAIGWDLIFEWVTESEVW
ncbi:hypothetical protein [Salinibaculum rarum]|nr:hypothetical protein [Salinibaculum sp. KK48]